MLPTGLCHPPVCITIGKESGPRRKHTHRIAEAPCGQRAPLGLGSLGGMLLATTLSCSQGSRAANNRLSICCIPQFPECRTQWLSIGSASCLTARPSTTDDRSMASGKSKWAPSAASEYASWPRSKDPTSTNTNDDRHLDGMWKTCREQFRSSHDSCMTGWGHNERFAVPWYSFTPKWPDGRSGNAASTSLSDDGHACRYAQLLIREFRARPGYSDPRLKLIVQNECGEIIADIAFSSAALVS